MRFVVVAGETSGDALGQALIGALRDRYPDAEFQGVGGERMIAAGCKLWDRYDAMAVMGFAEVVSRLPTLLKLRKAVIEKTMRWQPTCFIGIDAPDFNLPIERKLRAAGITTCHYVSPSIWAWRQKRAAKIAASTDLILTLFPFEPEIYEQYGGNAKFVGHPLADDIDLEPDGNEARRRLGLQQDHPLLAILPGSRDGELKRLGELFVKTASLLANRIKGLRFVSPVARPSLRPALTSLIDEAGLSDRWTVLDGDAQRAMIAANAILLASGTAALEAMLCKRPMVVSYRISPLTYRMVTSLGMLNSEHFSLPNVLIQPPVVPELMQHEATPENLLAAIEPLLVDPDAARRQTAAFSKAHQQLRGNGAARAAEAIATLVESRS